MSNLLEVCGVFKSFLSGNERLEVLSDLGFSLAQGEMAAITGASGSGKSTLLYLLGGMDQPDRGSILFEGREITGLNRSELSDFRNRTLGFVFQFHHLLPEFTALENVMMPLLLRGMEAAGAQREALAILDGVRLKDRSSHRPGALSGGEQQRVALARALVGKPRILLADEPTGNLDPHTGEGVAELIRSLHAAHGLTSIIVTHNERLACRCSHVFRLEEGKLRSI